MEVNQFQMLKDTLAITNKTEVSSHTNGAFFAGVIDHVNCGITIKAFRYMSLIVYIYCFLNPTRAAVTEIYLQHSIHKDIVVQNMTFYCNEETQKA